jgi:hypothetical protein
MLNVINMITSLRSNTDSVDSKPKFEQLPLISTCMVGLSHDCQCAGVIKSNGNVKYVQNIDHNSDTLKTEMPIHDFNQASAVDKFEPVAPQSPDVEPVPRELVAVDATTGF